MKAFPTRDDIAKAIYENHEEQCCTCGPWSDALDYRKETFLTAADAVLALLRGTE